MKPQETLILTRYVKACCPQQAIDEYTPDAWHDLLEDLDLADCREAAAIVAKRQPFVSPSEIRAEVRRIRNERIARSAIPAPSRELADDPRAYQQALRASVKQAADGHGEPVERLAIVQAPGDPRVQLKAPTTLRQAIGRFRRRAIPPRPATVPDEQRALEQAAESRASRPAPADDGTEEAS